MSAFKRKTYGKVKPVKQAKEEAPKKPNIVAIKSLVREIGHTAAPLHLDVLSQLIYALQDAVPYINFVRDKKDVKLTAKIARALVTADTFCVKARKAHDNEEKERCMLACIDGFRTYAAGVLEVPSLKLSLIKHKLLNKKINEQDKALNGRYDKLITMLMAAMSSMPFQIVVRANNDGHIKFDHARTTMFMSRPYANDLVKKLRKEGVLSVVVELAVPVARAMAYKGEGDFTVDQSLVFANYQKLLLDLVNYARTNPDAPNRLVRRTVPAKKRANKVSAKPPAPKKEKRYTLNDLQKMQSSGDLLTDALQGAL